MWLTKNGNILLVGGLIENFSIYGFYKFRAGNKLVVEGEDWLLVTKLKDSTHAELLKYVCLK